MASSAKDIQLLELKDTITQLKTMISEQTELIRSLRLVIDEKTIVLSYIIPAIGASRSISALVSGSSYAADGVI